MLFAIVAWLNFWTIQDAIPCIKTHPTQPQRFASLELQDDREVKIQVYRRPPQWSDKRADGFTSILKIQVALVFYHLGIYVVGWIGSGLMFLFCRCFWSESSSQLLQIPVFHGFFPVSPCFRVTGGLSGHWTGHSSGQKFPHSSSVQRENGIST